jgi:acyl-CoA reductase-like NAD-dependent aldehyde dehydrogenase
MAMTENQMQDVAAEAAAAATASEFAVENPATGEVIAHFRDLGPEEVASVARRGREVQPPWEALRFERRGRILRRTVSSKSPPERPPRAQPWSTKWT